MKQDSHIKNWTLYSLISFALATIFTCSGIPNCSGPMSKYVESIQIVPSCGPIVGQNINSIVIDWNCSVVNFSLNRNLKISPSLTLGTPSLSNSNQRITIPIAGGVLLNTDYTLDLHGNPEYLFQALTCGGQIVTGTIIMHFTVKTPDSVKPFITSFTPGLSRPVKYSEYTSGDSRPKINNIYTDGINVPPHIRLFDPNAIKAVFNELMNDTPVVIAQRYLPLHSAITSPKQQYFPVELPNPTVNNTSTNTILNFGGNTPLLPAFQYLFDFPSCRTFTLLKAGILNMGNQDLTGNPLVPCDDAPGDPEYDARCASIFNDEIRSFTTSRVRWAETNARRWFKNTGISLGGIISQDIGSVSPLIQSTSVVGSATILSTTWNGYKNFNATIPGGAGTPWYNLPDGNYILEARATLSGGGSGGSDIIPIGKDTVSPGIAISSFSPQYGIYVNATPIVSGTWNDPPPSSGLAGISFNVPFSNVSIGAGSFSSSLNLSGYPNGTTLNIIATATDTAGNAGSSSPVSVTIDSSPPSVSLNPPSPSFPSGGNTFVPANFTISGIVSDTESGPGIVEIYVNGNNVGTVNPIAGTFSYQFTNQSNGAVLNILAKAFDRVTNYQYSSILTVNVDAVGPTISTSADSGSCLWNSGILYDLNPTIQITYSDCTPPANCSDLNTSSLYVTLDGSNVTSRFTVGPFQATAQTPMTSGPHQLIAQMNDNLGNLGTNTLNITISSNPYICSVAPSCGRSGDTVTINGNNFGLSPAVTFNGLPALIQSSTNTQITTSVPSGATPGPVQVISAGNTSNTVFFRVVPTITGIGTNNCAQEGQTINITGQGFGPSESYTVRLTALNTATIDAPGTFIDANTLSFVVPYQAWDGPVFVIVGGCAEFSNSINITFIPSSGEKIYFVHSDPLGSHSAMTDQEGNIVWEAEYLPYGDVYQETGAERSPLKFIGKEQDAETGLYYFGARYMDPKTGRFIQSETASGDINRPQTWNRYAYSLNNPFRYKDPTGLYEEDFHKYLTRTLALATGFSRTEAQTIADADQGTDDNPFTSPVRGGERAREMWHFTSTERRQELWEKALKSGNLEDLGMFLHTSQDSFSHRGLSAITHTIISILTLGYAPDKTYANPDKAMAAARETYTKLLEFQKAQGYEVVDRWSEIEGDVRKFMVVDQWPFKEYMLEKVNSQFEQGVTQ